MSLLSIFIWTNQFFCYCYNDDIIYVQVDLFFYREPEEAKEQEEEEVVVAPDFGALDYTGTGLTLPGDEWPAQVPDAQFGAAAVGVVPPIPATEWNAAPGKVIEFIQKVLFFIK